MLFTQYYIILKYSLPFIGKSLYDYYKIYFMIASVGSVNFTLK